MYFLSEVTRHHQKRI